jgi:stage III sporulation protein AB
MQVLGASSVAEQAKQLELHLLHLRQLEKEAERSRTANEKIWRYLGVFSGLALVLILL